MHLIAAGMPTSRKVRLLIDAKSDHAAQWYESYGAARLLDAPLSLVLPFAMAIKALKQGN